MTEMGPLPKFQQLQLQMTQMIRSPETSLYHGERLGGLPIAPRRQAVYQRLFLNNMTDFIDRVFPVLAELVGEDHVEQLGRRFLQQHRAETPLFHELGEAFLQFLNQEISGENALDLPVWLFELAHYEWVEVALYVADEDNTECFDAEQIAQMPTVTPQTPLQLCPTAWPLAYQWPVDTICAEHSEQIQPKATFLLVYRNAEDEVVFIKLTRALFQLLWTVWQAETPLSFEQMWQQLIQETDAQVHAQRKVQAWQSLRALSLHAGILNISGAQV